MYFIETSMSQILIQSIGILALVFFFLSFQQRSRLPILYFHLFSMILYAIHFFLLGAITAVAMVTLNAIKTYVFSLRTKYTWADNTLVLYTFLASFVLAGVVFWESYHSLLLIFALCFVTLSHWQKETKKLRGIFFLSHPLWLAYDIIVGSYAGIISELVVGTSNALGYLRFETNKKKDHA